MKNAPLALLLFFILLQAACTKKEVPPQNPVAPAKTIDTIKPLPYLPAYPGSYWKYSDSSSITTSPNYVKDAYTSGNHKSDTFYVAVYEGLPLWGYRLHNEGLIQSQPLVRIMSDSMRVGASWTTGYASQFTHQARIIAKDTTITIAGVSYYPTIVLLNEGSYFNYGNGYFPESREYYTKDIGLIKTERLYGMGAVISEAHLVNYFINK